MGPVEVLSELRDRATYWHGQWETGSMKNAASSWGKHIAYSAAADLLAAALTPQAGQS